MPATRSGGGAGRGRLRMRRACGLGVALLVLGSLAPVARAGKRVRIEGGLHRPLYRQPVRGADRDTLLRRTVAVRVAPFELDRRPVTNGEFLAFVRAHPEWRRSRVSRLLADDSYLRHWRGDLDPGPLAPLASPVVHVSWFAARAYAEAHGGRLPTVAEWELVAAADEKRRDATRDPAFLARLRELYSRPAAPVPPAVGSGPPNAWGVQDLHSLVWEWTQDFNSALVSGESRADASLDRILYCGAGASNAADFADYAAFMRFAYRSSLEASYTTSQLGFRTARSTAPSPPARGPAAPGSAAPGAPPSLFELSFPLTDAEGRRRSLAEFRGRPFVASMVYTSCSSVCPRLTADLKSLERALPPGVRSRTRFVLFSLDPGRDTPAELARFAERHGLDRSRWTLLASGQEDMRTLAAVLGVRFRPDGGGEIAHSATIVVADGRGAIRHRQTGLAGNVQPLVAALTEAAAPRAGRALE